MMEQNKLDNKTPRTLTAQEVLEKVCMETGWKVKSVDKAGIRSQATSIKPDKLKRW